MSWFVDSYANLAQWRAIVERLATFHRAIVKARAESDGGFVKVQGKGEHVYLRNVTMSLPDGTKLLDDADLTLTAGHSMVITGRTGSGKSTLFRVLAGIWPFGQGEVEMPPNAFFLPQHPYIPLGTLRHVITYPHATDAFGEAEITQALKDAGLPELCDRLESDENWPMRLSGGEQQRIALARALLAKPDWIFLDEATASLDPEAEANLYHVLRQRLPKATLVSIAHRPSVASFHESRLVFKREGSSPGTLTEAAAIPAAGE
jgi:vitamin B12/bleomycin/antimicrobial peptide transport system ATP-binding/permease protein